jgi:hypothetical protein
MENIQDETIKFLQEKLKEQTLLKWTYLAKGNLPIWEEINLKEATREVEFYAEALISIKLLKKIQSREYLIENKN